MEKNSRAVMIFITTILLTFLCGATVRAGVAYDSGNRRDPFIPLTGGDNSDASLSSGVKLEGIIYDPAGQSMAVLNGKTYQPGDVVGDATVLRVKKDYVVISIGS